MADRRRFLRPALWTAAVLGGGGVLFALLLSAQIPYAETAAPPAISTPAPAPAPASVLPVSPWTIMGVEPVGVHEGPDDHTLLIQVQIPAGTPDCARDPRFEKVTEENGIIYADAVVTVLAAAVDRCQQKASLELPLTTTSPIANRTVVLNSLTTAAWNKLPDGTWGHCGPLGCDPPADHCAPVRIAQTDGEALSTTTRACDQDWLVADRTNAYRAPSNRVIYRWATEGWQGVMSVRTGGCAEILAKEPQFSKALCEKLATPP
ncbi:hypothetical protein [Amycolatopsis sp. NPDC051071]|uniref:hypothetical protein n=1 Tax=Amycolatopsis sp. NPDC051071 TaxID=3154637 RepID=UPI00344A43B0